MTSRLNSDMPWAIVQIKKRLFAIAAEHLRQIVMMPLVTAVPRVPHFVRGVIDLRGRVIPLIDLRVRLGMTSVVEELDELCKLLQEREEDHRRWLDELRDSVVERRAFKLTTDPHKCAFGKWYDSYRAEDPWIAGLLKKFDAPHKKIHGLSAQVKVLQEQGDSAGAAQLISGTGGAALSAMIQLFTELKAMVRDSNREIVLALAVAGQLLAITVDSAVAVEKLRPEDLPVGAMSCENTVVRRLGKRANSDEMVLVIEPERILDGDFMDSITAQAGRSQYDAGIARAH